LVNNFVQDQSDQAGEDFFSGVGVGVNALFLWASTSGSVQGRNLLADDWILWSFVDVDLGPMSVVFRHISIGKNCFDGTLGNARIAIYASVGVDVKTIG
jgi:hypothetical protein